MNSHVVLAIRLDIFKVKPEVSFPVDYSHEYAARIPRSMFPVVTRYFATSRLCQWTRAIGTLAIAILGAWCLTLKIQLALKHDFFKKVFKTSKEIQGYMKVHSWKWTETPFLPSSCIYNSSKLFYHVMESGHRCKSILKHFMKMQTVKSKM